MKQLSLTAAKQRMLRGETQYNKPSRFIHEIPRYLLKMSSAAPRKTQSFMDSDVSSDKGFRRNETPFHDTVFDKPQKGVYTQDQSSYKPFITPAAKQFEGSQIGTLNYGVGDTVKHIKFGVGVVTDITKGGKDYEVTVDFPNFGIKKLLSTFANLMKIE
jgi:DNA helicase-2/ATP-dependent DNA helicase PcrA